MRVLIDFKTSANRLRMYAAAAERLGMEPVTLAIHDLDAENGGRFFVSHESAELRGFEDRLGGWVDGIRSGRFVPVSEMDACEGCDFRSFCRHAPAEAQS